MPRIHRSTARAVGVAVRYSTRKHVRSNDLYTAHLTRSGPSKRHRVHKYYACCNSVVFVNIRCFPKIKISYFATSASSFDKNNYHKLHTVSRSAIIFRAENAAMVSFFRNFIKMARNTKCRILSRGGFPATLYTTFRTGSNPETFKQTSKNCGTNIKDIERVMSRARPRSRTRGRGVTVSGGAAGSNEHLSHTYTHTQNKNLITPK